MRTMVVIVLMLVAGYARAAVYMRSPNTGGVYLIADANVDAARVAGMEPLTDEEVLAYKTERMDQLATAQADRLSAESDWWTWPWWERRDLQRRLLYICIAVWGAVAISRLARA